MSKIIKIIIFIFPFFVQLCANDFAIFPVPQHVTFDNEIYDLTDANIVLDPNSDKQLKEIGQYLSRELATRFHLSVILENELTKESNKYPICLGLLSDPEIISLLEQADSNLESAWNNPEAYVLVVNDSGVVLGGGDTRGLFYGVQSLLQLIRYKGRVNGYHGSAYLRGVKIFDKPFKSFRGVHTFLPSRENIPFYKNFIKMLAHFKLNTLIVEVGGGMRLDRHPEINIAWEHFTQSMYDGGDLFLQYNEQIPLGKDRRFQGSSHTDLAGGSWLTKEEVKDIVLFARQYHVEVIPEIQGLSHAYYLAIAHRDIADPQGSPWPDAYDPANPKSYKILFDVIDEYLEVMEAKQVHIGHDEWRARVKGQPGNGEVFARDVLKIYHYLKARNINVMMWADHLIKGHNLDGFGSDERPAKSVVWYSSPSTEGAPEILANEAKDVLMANWSWGITTNAIKQIKDYGWNQILGNFRGIRQYEQWGNILSDTTLVGAEISTWCRADEYIYALNHVPINILIGQNILWSKKQYPLDMLYKYLGLHIPELRRNLSGKTLPSQYTQNGRPGYRYIPLELSKNRNRKSIFQGSELFDKMKSTQIIYNHIPLKIDMTKGPIYGPVDGTKTEIVSVRSNAASILFLHVSSGQGKLLGLERTYYLRDKAELIGYYRIHYTDGFLETVPIRYKENIIHLGSEYQDLLYYAQTVRLTDTETPVLASLYEWVCPRPNKQIEKIDMVGVDNDSKIYPIVIAVTVVKPPFFE